MSPFRLLPAASFLLCAASTQADSRPCEYSNLGPECAAGWIGDFGVPAAEPIARGGDRMRRAFYQDGFHRKVLSITFLRRRDGKAELKVDFAPPHFSWLPGREPLRVPIALELWERAAGATAGLRLIPHDPRKVDPDTGGIPVCAHASVWGIEIVEGRRRPVRRAVRSDCDDRRVPAVGLELARLAVSALPDCRTLERGRKYPASQLDGCGLLAGDRRAASKVLNRIQDAGLDLRFHAGSEKLAALFAQSASIDWDGARAQGRAAASALMARMLDERNASRLAIGKVEGVDAERVRVSGFVVDYPDVSAGRVVLHIAPFRMEWTRAGSAPFLMAEAQIGRSAPNPDSR